MAIDPKKLQINTPYTRAELSGIFGDERISGSREGLYPDGDHVIFFVTLDKENRDPSVSYEDYFFDGLFHWESQSTQAPHHKNIREILSGEMQPLLFVRQVAKVRSQTQPFIYAGRLEYLEHDPASSKPVKVIFDPIDVEEPISDPLKSLIDWTPSAQRPASKMPASVRQAAKSKQSENRGGQGFQADAEHRKIIEAYAMDIAARFYRRKGYDVEDVSRKNTFGANPFDLLCTKPGKQDRHVEVKGTTTSGSKLLLTRNEVVDARSRDCISDLFIVAEIEIRGVSGEKSAAGGKPRRLRNWRPQRDHLTALTYEYVVPEDWSDVTVD